MNTLMPKMVPTFLPMAKITTVFEDQYEHIIKKTMRYAETCLSNPVSRQAVMYCPPGSGKTTAWIVDLLWRIADLAKKSKKKNQLIVFTSPDDSINQDVYNQLLALYELAEKYEMLEEIGIKSFVIKYNNFKIDKFIKSLNKNQNDNFYGERQIYTELKTLGKLLVNNPSSPNVLWSTKPVNPVITSAFSLGVSVINSSYVSPLLKISL